jgi:hypothetical protein
MFSERGSGCMYMYILTTVGLDSFLIYYTFKFSNKDGIPVKINHTQVRALPHHVVKQADILSRPPSL